MAAEKGPSGAELKDINQARDQRIENELAAMSVGQVADKDVAEEMAYAERDARDAKEKDELTKAISSEDKLYKKTGEYRDTKAVREARAKVADVIADAGDEAGDAAGEQFIKDRAEVQKTYERNKDKALEMAYAEKPGRDMAANLEAIGSPDLAKGRVDAAKAAAKERGGEYKESADKALAEIDKVIRGEEDSALLRGENLDGWETVRQAAAGKDAEPVFEQDKGRGRNKVHESIYASSSSPNVVMIERRNPQTGEVISVHTVRTRADAMQKRGEAQIPSRELRKLVRSTRAEDLNKENSESTYKIVRSKGPRLDYSDNYGNVGEYTYLQRRRLEPGSGSAQENLAAYRAKRKAQRKAMPLWARLFGGF